MKLLISTFLTLLLIGFAGGSYGQDFEETKLLAEQGDAEAQLNLGIRYANGEGVPETEYLAEIQYDMQSGNVTLLSLDM